MQQTQVKGLMQRIDFWISNISEKNLTKSLFIIVFTGVFAALTTYITISRAVTPLPATGGTHIIRSVLIFVLTLLGFGFSIGVYHIASHLLGGIGNVKKITAMAGYASIPMLAQNAIRFIYYLFINDPTDNVPQLSGILGQILNHFTVFSIITLILITYAARQNYNISLRKAALVALIPIIISLSVSYVFRGIPLS